MTLRIPGRHAHAIDYTDVRKEITYADVERICLEARDHQVGAVVVPSALVHRAAVCLADVDVAVACYIGYPFGTQAAGVKAREAEVAVAHGATEIEVVPHYGAVRAARWEQVEVELHTVRGTVETATPKLVVELSYLSDDELTTVARIAADAGYALIANTAGFRIVSTRPETEAQATPEAIERLLRAAGGRIQPKAIGGIKTYAEVVRLLEAGAARVAVNAEPGILGRLAEEAEEDR
jgi:deoxyribose-phosphate aldolase